MAGEIIAGTDDGGDSEYLSAALRSSSPANPSYGYLWWLNGQTGYRVGPAGALQPGPLVPSAPSDLVAALGKDDQKIYVSRSAGLVVARQGRRAGSRSRESLSDFDAELWRLIVAARPASPSSSRSGCLVRRHLAETAPR